MERLEWLVIFRSQHSVVVSRPFSRAIVEATSHRHRQTMTVVVKETHIHSQLCFEIQISNEKDLSY
jgi:hypothetical protein